MGSLKKNAALLLLKVGLLPPSLQAKALNIKLNQEFWSWRKLADSGKGYFLVDPMPSESELQYYYQTHYGPVNFPAMARAGSAGLGRQPHPNN